MLHKELSEFDVAYEESLLNFIWNTLIFGEKYIYVGCDKNWQLLLWCVLSFKIS